MLVLKNVVKDYVMGDLKVEALRGIDLAFRKNEFVSVLGPSGCGKTTLLNIIGGLDRYSSGDLSVNGVSTKKYKDGDWDTYRNHSIGFVFQTYNLIMHQTVLSNVELALTLSGVSKSERRKRAINALKQVGLGDQLDKKPNQVSGGQMQRVAIARALVNNPEILLADEPTGALDSETSLQIMEILKEIAKDRLVIMVTHNPDIAEMYSTRIIRLLDGLVTDDSNPYAMETEIAAPAYRKRKKPPMSFFTALSLSLNNLMTKKARTFLTAFAGSIGIIGIAMILALSTGVQDYIARVEEDTLSSYPISIQKTSLDIGAMLSAASGMRTDDVTHELDKVYSNDIMGKMLSTMLSELSTNDLQAFKAFLDSEDSGMAELVNDIQYGYGTQMNIYASDTSDGILQINPNSVFKALGFSGVGAASASGGMMAGLSGMGSMSGSNVWQEMLGNSDVLAAQYEVIAGRMPDGYNEVVIIVDENNEITDFTLYSLGLKDPEELVDMMKTLREGGEVETQQTDYSYDELLSLTFKLVLNTDYYERTEDTWGSHSENEAFMKNVIDNATTVKVVGVLRPAGNAAVANVSGAVGYTTGLMTHLINEVNNSEIVRQQKEHPETDVFTGKPFATGEEEQAEFDITTLPEEQQAYLQTLDEDELKTLLESYSVTSKATYEENLQKLGASALDNPDSISIFPRDFESKDQITTIINDYNKRVTDEDKEEMVIQYTDLVGLMMSSVSTIINAISYVLIAFVSISLVVSSIMIGIITYISVLERTKEIGILRSIGASKKDISSVFNAETLIVGFVSGVLGIGVTLLLCIPANLIIHALTDISGVAALPMAGAVILVAISMALTFIAGLIPSRIAAKKDPVVALRTE